MNKLRRLFTKWYVRRGYKFGYDFTNVEIYGEDPFPIPSTVPKSIFLCPFWVKSLLIFFSPSVYMMQTTGKEIVDAFKRGMDSVRKEKINDF